MGTDSEGCAGRAAALSAGPPELPASPDSETWSSGRPGATVDRGAPSVHGGTTASGGPPVDRGELRLNAAAPVNEEAPEFTAHTDNTNYTHRRAKKSAGQLVNRPKLRAAAGLGNWLTE